LRNCLGGLADPARRINLQEVGAGLFLFAYKGTDVIRCPSLLATAHEWFGDRQDPRRRKSLVSRGLAKRDDIVHALNCGEAGEQRSVSVRRSSIRGFRGGGTHAGIFTVRSEAGCDVDMRINPTRHHSQTPKIEVDWRSFWIDGGDL